MNKHTWILFLDVFKICGFALKLFFIFHLLNSKENPGSKNLSLEILFGTGDTSQFVESLLSETIQ